MTALGLALIALRSPARVRLALELADLILEEAEDLARLRTRMARKALAGDLDEPLSRLMQLSR